MKIFIVLASRSRSKAAGAASMPVISEVRSATWSPPSVSRAITAVDSSTYVKQPCTPSSLTRIVSGSSTPAADYDDGALGPRRGQSAVATGQLSEDEARFRRAADGRYRWFLARGLPLRDQHGKIVRRYGTLTNIKDRKRAGDHPRDTRIRLTRAWQIATVADPSASIAHELNRSTGPSYLYLLTLKRASAGWQPIRQICRKLTHRLNE